MIFGNRPGVVRFAVQFVMAETIKAPELSAEKPTFLSIGECMVELSPAGTGLWRQGFAGDTFNTAWYLRRELSRDWRVEFCSAVGRDELSERFLRFAAESGLGTGHVRRVAEATLGLYLISLDRGERSFSYWRGQSAARQLADDPAALDRAADSASWIYFSGITLAILPERSRACLLGALRRARGRGVPIAFDPNMRPRLWPDGTTMLAEIDAGAAACSVVLPSFEEESAQRGDTHPEVTLARYARLGVSCVVVKDGCRRIHALRDGRVETHDPQRVEPVDTTAAGDSFNAGLLAALATGEGMPVALARGAALARRVVSAPGALVEAGRRQDAAPADR